VNCDPQRKISFLSVSEYVVPALGVNFKLNICGLIKTPCEGKLLPAVQVTQSDCLPLSRSLVPVDMELKEEKGIVILLYKNGITTFWNAQTRLEISCGTKPETLIEFKDMFQNDGVFTFVFTIQSDKACPRWPGFNSYFAPVGFGGVLLIAIVALFLIYVVIGTILKCIKYKSITPANWIPNYHFWREIPLLIRDGFFLVSFLCVYPLQFCGIGKKKYQLIGLDD
jgi:hypothetical protein